MTAFAPSGAAQIAYDAAGGGPPVLLGDLDLEDIRDTSEGLAERIPGASFEVLEGTAHLPQLERHPRCLEAIRELLAGR